MSPLCNASSEGPTCNTVPGGAQTGANNSFLNLSNLTQIPGVDDNDDDDDEVIWVPYLSVICLIAVCITLSFSFFRYWKRVKKRRRNIQDYMDHNIDLNRKRLFGMMRMPFDMSQEYFNASSDGSGNLVYTPHPFQNQYQYSHDFSSVRGTMDIQRGGLQRYESMASTIPGITLNDRERHCYQPECQHQSDMSLEPRQLCYHHCFVTCQFCWPVFQNELRSLLKSTQDDLYYEHESSIKSPPAHYKDSHVELCHPNESRTKRILDGTGLPTSDFSNRDNSENRKTYRPCENEEYENEYRGFPSGNGARPKVSKRDSGLSLKKQRAMEQFDENVCNQGTDIGTAVQNTRVHSDSDLQQPKTKNSQSRQKRRDSLIKTRTVYSEDLSQAPSTVVPNSHNNHLEKRQRLLSETTTPSPPLHSYVRATHSSDSPVPRSVAFANTIFREVVSPSDQSPPPPPLAENGGVINYGFQTDSLSSLYNSQANFADAETSPRAIVTTQNLTNCDETGTNHESPTTGKRKKKPFLKTRRQFSDASISSSLARERKAQTFSQTEDRKCHPQQFKEPHAHSIDLSIIDIDKDSFGSFPYTGSFPTGHSLSANNDINV